MEQEKKNKKGKYILIGLGVIALAGTAAFLYSQHKKRQNNLFAEDLVSPNSSTFEPPVVSVPARTTGSSTTTSSGSFPLKRGSRGPLVKNIQKALIARYGKSILPKFGADGHWGSEMQSALKRKGLPTTISESLFNQVLTSGAINQLTGAEQEPQLRTIEATKVWNETGGQIRVPAATILGEFVDAENEVTQFRTIDNRLLFINTNSISYV